MATQYIIITNFVQYFNVLNFILWYWCWRRFPVSALLVTVIVASLPSTVKPQKQFIFRQLSCVLHPNVPQSWCTPDYILVIDGSCRPWLSPTRRGGQTLGKYESCSLLTRQERATCFRAERLTTRAASFAFVLIAAIFTCSFSLIHSFWPFTQTRLFSLALARSCSHPLFPILFMIPLLFPSTSVSFVSDSHIL